MAKRNRMISGDGWLQHTNTDRSIVLTEVVYDFPGFFSLWSSFRDSQIKVILMNEIQAN